ncbi:hypothetical protein Q3D25_02495 [Enterococcus faecium]|uniref:hypothetical protein n=1 Tax=Enterococcus faecium TaxID=1352 RepID=UPI00032E26FD|nr:hypothetical protein [Enterococcus faecium]EME8171121.1 hypothetical protein [Enterococcus faecium]EOI38525.1 hypothetical protein UE9_01141 [Enterococcus faecium EnGen0267]MDL0413420.1 hypothetical protein [Enterococcus faecium]MDQ8277882.1 hypothetical protein [Enterococcus faecium]MDQ8420659.1 hypothetical protein [Enterococcus faecium]
MNSKKLTAEELTEKQEKVKAWLHILDKIYGVKMTVFSKSIGVHNQNLHNFRKGKRGLTEEKTVLLEKVIVLKYGRLLMLEDSDYEN